MTSSMIIGAADHPASGDADAIRVTGGIGPGVYLTACGYVACLPSGLAVDGFFPDKASALVAQVGALDDIRRGRFVLNRLV